MGSSLVLAASRKAPAANKYRLIEEGATKQVTLRMKTIAVLITN